MITNKYGLPEPIVQAVENDPYDKGDCRFSATELIAPPYQRKLMKDYADAIEVDASERIWSLFGQAVHHILERSGHDNYILERRYMGQFEPFNGIQIRVGAKIDVLDKERMVLSDYKCTSVYKFKRNFDGTLDVVPEYEQQLNIQAECIFQETGQEVKEAHIVGILRDWRKSEAMREDGYPKSQVEMMPVRIWPQAERVAYIEERCRLHMSGAPEPCSASETWERPAKWALMKPPQKRAVKLYDDQHLAEQTAGAMNQKAGVNTYSVEARPGTRVRCAGYCEVAPFCPHYKAYLAKQEEKT